MDDAPGPSSERGLLGLLKSAGLSALYLTYLVISSVFSILVLLFQELLRNPCWYGRAERGRRFSGSAAMIAVDAIWAVAAYWLADYLRCVLWQETAWPEIVENYGSSLSTHIEMSAFVAVVWPVILYALGWYKPRWRSVRWKILRTAAALAVLGLSMAAVSLLRWRELYPRMEIAFVVVVLPSITILTRTLWDVGSYLLSRPRSDVSQEY